MVPIANLHEPLRFAALYQSANFERKGMIFSIFVEYKSTRPWFTMCQVVQSVLRNKVPLRALKTMAQESEWERGVVRILSQTSTFLT